MKPIKNIQNLSLTELLYELCNSDVNPRVADFDLYLHIRKITDNFDNQLMLLLMFDIHTFWSYNVLYEHEDKNMTIDEILKNSVKLRFNNKTDDKYYFKDTINLGGLKVDVDYDDDGSRYYMWKIDNCGLKPVNENGYNNIRRYFDIAIDEYVNRNSLDDFIFWVNNYEDFYYEKQKRGFKSAGITKFENLFKKEYQNKIDRFKSWLKREEYINDTNEITASNYTNFARLFYLLRDNSIINPNINNTKGITAYFKEFGVNVVETLNSLSETPEIARKTVTNENAKDFTQLGMTEKETTNLLNLFKNN